MPCSKGQSLAPQLPLLPQLWCPSGHVWAPLNTNLLKDTKEAFPTPFVSLIFFCFPFSLKEQSQNKFHGLLQQFPSLPQQLLPGEVPSPGRWGLGCAQPGTHVSIRGSRCPPVRPPCSQDCSSCRYQGSKSHHTAPDWELSLHSSAWEHMLAHCAEQALQLGVYLSLFQYWGV